MLDRPAQRRERVFGCGGVGVLRGEPVVDRYDNALGIVAELAARAVGEVEVAQPEPTAVEVHVGGERSGTGGCVDAHRDLASVDRNDAVIDLCDVGSRLGQRKERRSASSREPGRVARQSNPPRGTGARGGLTDRDEDWVRAARRHHRAGYPRRGDPLTGSTERSVMTAALDLDALDRRRDEIRDRHLRPPEERPESSARGVHHIAALSSDVEQTVRFYQDLLEFPLTDMFENRDYQGFDALLLRHRQRQRARVLRLPRSRPRPVRGGARRPAPSRHLGPRPTAGSTSRPSSTPPASPYEHISGSSIYFSDPDGARLELISDPLGEMYGNRVL